MKKYIPEQLAAISRYQNYIPTLPTEIREELYARMGELIEEEKAYCDKGNYKHMAQILTSVALYEVLQRHGQSEEEAYRIVSEEMWKFLEPSGMQKLARKRFFLPLMKKIVPFGFKKGSGAGWRYTWHEDDPKDEFHFECNECLYEKILGRRGLLKLGAMCCHADVINYGNLPYTDFIRTETLCQGGALTIACAKRNPQGRMVGCDVWGPEYAAFSRALCEHNASAEGAKNVFFREGNAVKLPFADESFDAVTSNYVYHNIVGKNKQQLLLETLRVLKKGGVFAIHDIMSKQRYGDMGEFIKKLRLMGYEKVELIDTTDGKFMSRAEAATMFLTGSALLCGVK